MSKPSGHTNVVFNVAPTYVVATGSLRLRRPMYMTSTPMSISHIHQRQDWGQPAPLMKDMIILAACEANESLPQHRDLPADVFTSCLTTPIRTALRWFVPRSSYKSKLETDIYERIPGRQSDRKTMLGELNWIFTAITDTIAWDVLPRDLFQRLFRQDLLVASLFRNFLLAERIMRSLNCTPRSHPKLPQTHEHHMWSAWDRAAENCLSQLSRSKDEEFQPSPFFSEQLLAFQEWLKYATETSYPPLQLPIVLQVLLSQSHRHRALELLGQFLDKGSWAVDLALSVGIFPYVLKLLQTSAPDLRELLVFIWTKILAWDKSCQVDLVKDNGHMYFIKYLRSEDVNAGHNMEYKTMALFVLSVIVDKHPKGQESCLVAGLLDDLQRYLREATERGLDRSFIRWVCLCLAKLWDGQYEVQGSAFENDILSLMVPLLEDPEPEVRATAVYALGTLLSVNKDDLDGLADDAAEVEERMRKEREIARRIWPLYIDGSIPVRRELGIAIMRLAHAHKPRFQLAAAAYMKPPLMPKQTLKGLHPSSSFPAITLPGALRPGRQSPRVVFQGMGGADLHIGAGIPQNSITTGLMHGRDPSSDPGRDGLGLQLVNPGSRLTQGGDQQSPDTKVMGSAPIRADHMRNLGEIPLSSAASPPNGTPPSPALHGSLGSDSSFHSDDVLRDSNSVGLRIAISDAARATDVEDRKLTHSVA
ncbi:hypothetical protein CBR_g54867 [Chara braunii]|uniref:Uncharacterized protein n=1 Tax=Chara braunii TaxID=69332 RepID=A0A388JPN7_CHABU|nr:hypothetical protein CBR_g54867 [Chara braunii]|eukprot:GBG59764.1 hypothetical protein CBR_g54867 [Chara braunii]